MKNKNCDKLIIAVLQGDDYMETIDELNSHGFYVTILNSSGGFLKKKSVTQTSHLKKCLCTLKIQ